MSNNTLFSSASQDVVGVFQQDTSVQLFTGARPIKAKINTSASVMTHPVEDGSTITDHKVINPVEIELSLILSLEDYRSVYQAIKSLFEKSTLLTVQTRSGTYRSMIISSMPHDEDADLYDAIALALKLTEVKFAKYVTGKAPKVSAPKDKRNSKTSNGGKKQMDSSKKAPEKKSSILYGVFN